MILIKQKALQHSRDDSLTEQQPVSVDFVKLPIKSLWKKEKAVDTVSASAFVLLTFTAFSLHLLFPL